MSDFLLQIGEKKQARKIVSALGIPIPQKLRRARGAWSDQFLEGKDVVVGGKGELHKNLAQTLAPAGATVYFVGNTIKVYNGPGEAYARPVQNLEYEEVGPKAYAYIYDATGIKHPDDLEGVYAFFKLRIKSIARCGRILVFGRPVEHQKTVAAAAAAHALQGFVRSVAKEIGRKGATSQMVYVEHGAEERISGLLRFLLSERSAYISGQPFWVKKAVTSPNSIPFVRPLEGKIALVTGAARGIGAGTAEVLAREGAHVVCLDRPADDEPLGKVVRKIKGTSFPQDIYESDAVENIATFFDKNFEGVDIVVHNAGITRDKTLGNMDAERWEQTIGINLTAVINITDKLLQGCLRNDGRIICLSSIAGIAGNFGQTNYAASKSGIIGFVESLAPTVAEKGISVNAIAPGFIETRMTARIPFLTRAVGRRLCNLSQAGLPQDIGETVAFLASPGAFGITGSVIRVCGGSLLGA